MKEGPTYLLTYCVYLFYYLQDCLAHAFILQSYRNPGALVEVNQRNICINIIWSHPHRGLCPASRVRR